MSVDQAEMVGGSNLTPEQFIAALESTAECFLIAGGIFGGRGETETVEVTDYHAPIADFLDIDKLRAHVSASQAAQRTSLPLEVGSDFRYAFDPEDTWFRIGRGAFLLASDRRIPVRIALIDNRLHWLFRDARDFE